MIKLNKKFILFSFCFVTYIVGTVLTYKTKKSNVLNFKCVLLN